MLTQSLENTYQNSKLSDKVRQVFVLSLIFLGLYLVINLMSLVNFNKLNLNLEFGIGKQVMQQYYFKYRN